MIMAVIGAFAARGDPVDVYMMLGLGFIGFLMRRVGIPEAPLVITFLIAPLLEEILRRALLISRGDWGRAVGSALGIAAIEVGMRTILGVAVGASVTPELLGRLPEMALTVALVPLFVLLFGTTGYVFFRNIAGLLGWRIAKRMRMFGAPILGPLILAGILSMTGLLTVRPPAEAIIAALRPDAARLRANIDRPQRPQSCFLIAFVR